MRSLAADNCAYANDRIKLTRSGELQSQQWNLKSSRNFVDLNQFFIGAQTFKSIKRAIDQARANEVVPPTGNNRETKSLTVKMTFVNYWLQNYRLRSLPFYQDNSEYRGCVSEQQVRGIVEVQS